MKSNYMLYLKVGLIMTVIILFISCSKPKDPIEIVNDSIRAVVQKMAHDPASYEFISTHVYDTVKDDSGVVCGYEFLHECRLNNAMGAKIKTTYYVLTGKDFRIYNFTNDRKKRFLTPCLAIKNASTK